MTTILLSSPGLGEAPLSVILMFIGIVWLIVGWLGIVAGIVTGLVCSRFNTAVSPGSTVITGLAVGSMVGIGGCASSLVRDLSIIPEMLAGGLITAALTAAICFSFGGLGARRRRSGPAPPDVHRNDLRM